VRPALVVTAAIGILLAGALASTSLSAGPDGTSTRAQRSLFAPPRELVLYGHVKTLVKKGRRYELRFDPALWLGGVTANRAAIEDGVIKRGEAVPNDYYVREDGHRLLTYRVPATAHVTVLTQGPRSTVIPVSELAQVVAGKNPRRRHLFDRQNFLGYWIRVALDTVRALDQQYQP
jgi:hypothetical protein